MKYLFNAFFWMGVATVAGVFGGLLFLKYLPALPIAPNQPVVQLLAINKPIVMGFVPYWLLGKVSDTALSTINEATYFGMEIGVDGTLIRQTKPSENEPGWQALQTGKFSDLIQKKPSFELDRSLLVHLANETNISALLTDPTQHAQNLVTDAEPIMKQYGFTDLNVDIESFRVASPSAQMQMTAFLQELKNGLTQKKLGTLTTELTVASLVKNQLLEPEAVGKISDRVVLMAYDFHYRGSWISGAVAPLGGAKQKWEYDVIESVKIATKLIPSEKILLGIPLYGYEWETLSDQPESPVIPGTGKTSTVTRVDEIKNTCDGCQVQREDVSGSPYLILPPNEDSATQQIFFEDKTSIQQKVDLAKEYKLAGVALWAVGYETDDLLSPFEEYKKIEITRN